MFAVFARFLAWLPAIGALLWVSAQAGDEVALRAGNGRFLRINQDGSFSAERLFPTEPETFQLLGQAANRLTLQSHEGRTLVVEGPGNCRVRFGNPPTEQAVEIYRIYQVPEGLRSALAAAIDSLATEKLADKPYDKVTTRKQEEYVELPAPTLRDLGHKTKQRVLSLEEQSHVQAALDGPLGIQITHMPYLKNYTQPEASLLLLAIEASLPVRGRAEYRIPPALSTSTGFHAAVGLSVVAQLRTEKADDGWGLGPPQLLDMQAELRSLDFSNDVLHVARRQVRQIVNSEIEKNHDRIQQQANEAIAKAVEPRQLRSPLLRYLNLLY